MNADTEDIMRRAKRLVYAATGEEYGDGYVVTDIGIGYAEPGYHDDETVWVLGNWNNKRLRWENDPPLTLAERLPSRLATALERIGAEIEWLDEWVQCSDCYRIVRCSPDSYSWRQSFAWFDGCEPVCHECLEKMGADAIEDYTNDPDRCITWCDEFHLKELGWESYNGQYQNGWHPGMDDDPDKIFSQIREESNETLDVVFLLDESSQFYIGFSAWVRRNSEEPETPEETSELTALIMATRNAYNSLENGCDTDTVYATLETIYAEHGLDADTAESSIDWLEGGTLAEDLAYAIKQGMMSTMTRRCDNTIHYGCLGPVWHNEPNGEQGWVGACGKPTDNDHGFCDECAEDWRVNYPQYPLQPREDNDSTNPRKEN